MCEEVGEILIFSSGESINNCKEENHEAAITACYYRYGGKYPENQLKARG